MVIVWKRARGGGSGCWVMPLASHSMRLVHGSGGGMRDVSGGYASVCKVTAKGIPRRDILLDRRGHMQLIWGQSQVATHSSISSAAPRPRQPSGTFHVRYMARWKWWESAAYRVRMKHRGEIYQSKRVMKRL